MLGLHSFTLAIRLGLTFPLLMLMGSSSLADDRSESFSDLSIESLLATQLDQMSISGIHHTHEKGEWMVGYHFMYMDMDGNRRGTRDLSTQDVNADFAVVPLNMYMEMHMVHLMYGISDNFTAMLVVPYTRKAMDHIRIVDMNEVRFTTRTRGLGDIALSGLYSVYRNENHRVIGKGGLSVPSGSIDESDNLPGMMAMPDTIQRLPYPMQLGSGTWDLLLGATYLGQVSSWSWGADISSTVRLGKNKYDYRLGNEYDITAWGSRMLSRWCSGSLRLKWGQRFNIHGADASLNPAMVPTADSNRRAGRRLDVLFGINLFGPEGQLEGSRLMFETGIPVYQSLDGPQLESDWTIGLNLERTF